jgi:hypothetical protein
MTTMAKNTPRAYETGGNRNAFPVVAADIIFEGSAVGLVDASGHAQPLTSADKFGGFAERKADNSDGAAAAINVEVYESGKVQLSVTGAVITDVGQPVYATDDNAFTMAPVGGVFVGFVHRFISAGVVMVDFDAPHYLDPWGTGPREAITGAKTLDSEDSGKTFFMTTTATVTLPAVATPALCRIVNGGAFGAVAMTISPNASDSVEGPDITAADDKDIVNTGATARRGDFVTLGFADANGYAATELVGTWAREA